jgi:adenine deaminase
MTTKTRVQSISGRVVDLFKREIFPGTVEWAGGRITAVRRDPKVKEKRLIMPGLVDAHIHIESSLLPPSEFARLAVIHGTVATVSDPHEIANVLGEAGVRYMLADAKRSPLKFNFGAPSCVPATTFETAGAKLDSKAVARLLKRKDVRYLAEVMNFPGVLGRDPELMAMIASAKAEGKQVDGHAPGLRGEQAKAYADAGPTTDHECFTEAEARDKLAAGMKILIREGSAARNFEALAALLKTDAASCMFCCDDLHPDLLVKRHLDEHVRRALKSGADFFDVLRAASVNPVDHYGLKVGLLRVGDPADFIVVESAKRFRVQRTYIDGALMASGSRTRLKRVAPKLANKFKAKPVKAADFAVKVSGATVNVIQALNGQLVTKHLTVPVADIGVKKDVLKIAVVNRYATKAPVAVGYIRGFGLKAGALASSVAHDSHNIVAVGVDDESLAAAVNLVIAEKGGLSVVGPRVKAVLPLPIAGLMSALDGREAARRYTLLDLTAKKLGSKLDAPFMTLSFMALLVIPDLKMSDLGLFSAAKWGFVAVAE